MPIKHQGSAEYEARKAYDQLVAAEIHNGANLFHLFVDSALCSDAAYLWSELSFVRRMKWVRMAKRINAGCLNFQPGDIDWYKS